MQLNLQSFAKNNYNPLPRGAREHRVLRGILVLAVLGFSLFSLQANTYISYSYGEEPLIDIIEDLEQRYDLVFVYSPQALPTDTRISARSGLVSLDEGLQLLFANTAIEYRRRDLRVLLRFNRTRAEELLTARENEGRRQNEAPPTIEERITPSPAEVQSQTELGYTEEEFESLPPPPPLIDAGQLPEEQGELRTQDSSLYSGRYLPTRRLRGQARQRRLGQFSVLPGLGTNGGQPRKYINTISFNIPAGVSGGLNGAEFGVAFNGVDGEAVGLQLGLGVNYVSQRLTGVQITPGFNVIGLGEGVQIAGLVNISRRSLNGTQLAGLINFTRNNVNRQYAVANVAGGEVRRQIGLVNFGGDVSRGQIGILNVADTVAGRSFGLINIVRKGYNVFEIARDFTTAWSANLKLGSYRFYNIFEINAGLRSLELITEEGRGRRPIWGVGYGFGWKNRGSDEWGPLRTSSEFVINHVNRGARWMGRLNLYLHFRQTWDYPISGGTAAIFFGPTLVLHWTELTDQELKGMQPWNTHIFRERYDQIRFSAMIGLRFGVRLGQL